MLIKSIRAGTLKVRYSVCDFMVQPAIRPDRSERDFGPAVEANFDPSLYTDSSRFWKEPASKGPRTEERGRKKSGIGPSSVLRPLSFRRSPSSVLPTCSRSERVGIGLLFEISPCGDAATLGIGPDDLDDQRARAGGDTGQADRS